MNENDNKQQGLQIELTPEIAQGEYANFAIITHSSSDFMSRAASSWLPNTPSACWPLCRRTSCVTNVSMDR